MKARVRLLSKVAVAIAAFIVFSAILFTTSSISTRAMSEDFDAAAYYKTKCAMCHGPKAEKKFDATLPDDQMLTAIMAGKKSEKPPNMPEFQSKGVTTEQATSLVAYMKSLRN